MSTWQLVLKEPCSHNSTAETVKPHPLQDTNLQYPIAAV